MLDRLLRVLTSDTVLAVGASICAFSGLLVLIGPGGSQQLDLPISMVAPTWLGFYLLICSAISVWGMWQ